MRPTRLAGAGAVALGALLTAPAAAFAQDEPLNLNEAVPKAIDELNTTWVLVATVLVFFMQAGFAFLEIGFSRGKNAGMGIDRKSTRLNSSHANISYAGFCLKKKKHPLLWHRAT